MSKPERPNKPRSSPVQRTNMLIEKMSSEFTVFGDGLRAVQLDLKSMKMAIADLDKDVKFMKPIIAIDIPAIKNDIAELKRDVAELKSNMVIVKGDVKEMRGELRDHDRRLSTVETRPA